MNPRHCMMQVSAPSGAPASASAPSPQGAVPITLVVEQTDSRFPNAERVDVRAQTLYPRPACLTQLPVFLFTSIHAEQFWPALRAAVHPAAAGSGRGG